jgi:hypothetical protein
MLTSHDNVKTDVININVKQINLFLCLNTKSERRIRETVVVLHTIFLDTKWSR